MKVQWNFAAFDKAIKDKILITERGASDVVKQETRLFLRDVVKLTPPTGKQPIKENTGTQHKFGLRAIQRDIRRAFIPIEEMSIIKTPKNPKLAEEIQRYARRQEFESLKEVFRRVNIKNPLLAFAAERQHNAVRNSRGVVPKKTVQSIIMRQGSVADFTKKKQALSGLSKSGWNKACDGVGVKIPVWIKKHSGPGIYQGSLIGPRPFITVGNSVDFIQSAGVREQIIQRALDRRAESMRHQNEKMMHQAFSGYGKPKILEPVSVD